MLKILDFYTLLQHFMHVSRIVGMRSWKEFARYILLMLVRCLLLR